MGLFENFPYTNFHNLNLDWVIKVLKNAVSELEEIQTNWENVRDTANTAKTTADTAKTTADTAKTTADVAKTAADSALAKSTKAASDAELALIQSSDAQNSATSAEAASNNALEIATQAKNTADGIASKADTALKNSQVATEIAEEAESTANAAAKKSTANTEAITNLNVRCNNIAGDASNALSLAQTNETDIASLDGDVARFNTLLVETYGQSFVVANLGQTAFSLSSTDYTAGRIVIDMDYSDKPEILSWFDTFDNNSKNWKIIQDHHCYIGYSAATRVPVPAFFAAYPNSSSPKTKLYVLLPKAAPAGVDYNKVYTQLECCAVPKLIYKV